MRNTKKPPAFLTAAAIKAAEARSDARQILEAQARARRDPSFSNLLRTIVVHETRRSA